MPSRVGGASIVGASRSFWLAVALLALAVVVVGCSSEGDSEALAAAESAASAAQTAATAAQAAASAAQEASAAAQKAVETVGSSAPASLESDPGKLVIYSGRSESLVAPLIDQFKEVTGIDVQVKYGSTSEMAATLLEEGSRTPADVFFAQDPGGLGAVAAMFSILPSDIPLAVPEWARAGDGSWVGISGRARVLVHGTSLGGGELPESIRELTDPKWKGRVGWAPTNGSFQTMVTAMRKSWGEEETRDWLEGMHANDTKQYPKNTPQVAAAAAGEIDIGLVNHYYLHRFIQEEGDNFAARNLFLKDAGPASLVMVAGAGVLETASNRGNAEQFLRFMVSPVAQQYFATQTFEYPLVDGVRTHRLLPPIETLNGPDMDISSLADLQGTQTLLRDIGIIP